MSQKFKCIINGNKLIIEPRPNGVTTIHSIKDLLKSRPDINEIIISEGIELIGPEYFSNLNNIVKVTFPSSLKQIDEEAFSYCRDLKEIVFSSNPLSNIKIGDNAFFYCTSLENINLQNGVIHIGADAFYNCTSLKEVYLFDSLTFLGERAFLNCKKLKAVRLPSCLETIPSFAFSYCRNLEDVILPITLKQINSAAFIKCSSLKNISLPNSLIQIGNDAFNGCNNLQKIEFNEGLEMIGNNSFYECRSLSEINFPSTLKYIDENAFSFCDDLKKVVMGNGIIKMGASAFASCSNLEDITLSNNLKEIPSKTFYDCFHLKKVIFPESVQILHQDIFYRCHELKEIILSKNIKKIPNKAFSKCDGLERIVIPEGVKEIEGDAFAECFKLTDVYLPTTLKRFDKDAFFKCKNLSNLYLKINGTVTKLDMYQEARKFIWNIDKIVFLYNPDEDTYEFYKDEKCIEFKAKDLLNNDKILKLISLNNYNIGMYIRLYLYSKKKFIPSNVVIENMPLDDIDKFYINNNDKEWAKLVKACVNVNLDENKASLFKLCYVLGVFSESTSIRDKAVDFIKENIISNLDGGMIHSKFDGFDLSNGFNEEFAEFFIKYYKTKDFMLYGDEYDEVIDLTCASYNNFKQVKKIYPNKTLHTNREADLLLPIHVMNAVRCIEYCDIDVDNEEFALIVGRYGYTQEQFEKLQGWYNRGKTLTNLSLFVSEDKEKEGIIYELLSKDNPLNAVLGNITNCCQVVGGMGQSCVEYGMTMPNSGFITFNYKDKIIGQAWVWYDEKSKTICLDNIEIPHKYLEKIHQNKAVQNSFVDCLLRIEKSFKEEMNKRGLKVEKVTIGKGYNDIEEILCRNFMLSKYSTHLSDYSGYTDASSQYVITSENRNKKR